MAKKEKKAKKGKEKEEEAPEGKEADAAPEEKPAGEGEAEGGEGGEAAPAKPKNKRKRVIIAVVVVLVLAAAGGGGAYFFLGHKKSADEASAEGGSSSAKIDQPTYFDLPELLVNLNTNGKQTSFIKATITLELGNKDDVPVLQANLPRLMDSYNTFLREMHASDLYGSAGVYRLREEMLSRANTILAPVQVKDVLFREILIQ